MNKLTSTTTTTTIHPNHTLTSPPNNFYDSLPYIDHEGEDAELHAQVVALIGQEMQSSSMMRFKTYKDMVEELYPTISSMSCNNDNENNNNNDENNTGSKLTFSKNDYNAYATTQTTTHDGTIVTRTNNTMNIPHREPFENKYIHSLPSSSLLPQQLSVTIPPNPSDLTEAEWYSLLDQLSTSIEYHQKYLVDLELLKRYGKDQWVNAIHDSNALTKQLNNGINNLGENIEYIHKVRRYRQEMVKDELEQIKQRVFELIQENKTIGDKVQEQQKINKQYQLQQQRQQQRHQDHDDDDDGSGNKRQRQYE